MSELFSLSNKAAIVTGGTGVLGGAIARGLAAAGATVAFSTGHSVGNKRIDVVSAPVANVVKARLTVSEYVGATLTITRFAVYPPCPAAH